MIMYKLDECILRTKKIDSLLVDFVLYLLLMMQKVA